MDKINCVEEIDGKIVGHEIYQNSNNANCYQNERDIKIPALKRLKEGGINTANTKEGTDRKT